MRLTPALLAVLAALPALAAPPTTRPATAIDAFIHAADALVADGPSASVDYDGLHDYPPYPANWLRLEKQAWEQNAPARAIARQAAVLADTGKWPEPGEIADPKSPYGRSLNQSRALANDLGDAALYAQTLGRQNEAIALCEDLDNQVFLLKCDENAKGSSLRLMVAVGIDALRCARMLTLAPQLDLSPAAKEPIDRERFKRLIHRLLVQTPGQKQWDNLSPSRRREIFRDATGQVIQMTEAQSRQSAERAVLAIDRVNAERTFVAMSLACQWFKADNARWPETGDELVPAYLPKIPIDPWSNPPVPFGYSLEIGGLPDGGDRPLVYSQQESKDGLRHTMDGPLTHFYPGDGNAQPGLIPGKHGQFRDVAPWPATTQPAK